MSKFFLRALACALCVGGFAERVSAASPLVPTLPVSETGVLGGSAFRIDIPANWNGSLVVAAHGYFPAAAALPASWPRYEFASPLLERGYAVVVAGYRHQGWALAEAVEDSEALRRTFVERYGQPKRTFMIGSSMGGLVAVATQETQSDHYDGALALCGALAPAEEATRDRVLALLVAFDAWFPGVLSTDTLTLADAELAPDVSAEKLEAALAGNPERAEILARKFQIKRDELAGHTRFYYVMLRELVARSGGFPVDNRAVVYSGFGDDAAFNRAVRRYTANAAAAEYLRRNYTPTGHLAHPLMVLHTTYDGTVPPSAANRYMQLARTAGSEPLVVSRFAQADGHCNFSAGQVGGAFDALVSWVEKGEKPAAGVQN